MARSDSQTTRDEVPLNFLFENSIFLIAGALGALVWAHFSPDTHHHFFHFPLRLMFEDYTDFQHEVDVEDALQQEHDDDPYETAPETSHAKTQRPRLTTTNLVAWNQSEDPAAGDSQAGGAQSDTAGPGEPQATETQATESPSAGNREDGEVDGPHGAEVSGHADAGHADAGHTDGEHDGGHHEISLHFIINDILMALFFAIATKEVWESMLPGGSLANPRKAALPLLATFGGVVGPALVYLAGALLVGWGAYARGWAVPCATDIAFSYLVARLIFGNTHPAIAFLLLLAIADDAIGLVIIAVFYPQGPLQFEWLSLTLAAMALTYTMRLCRIHSFWWYLLVPGALSWFSFYEAGVHAALGLVPIIPLMPHAKSDLGVFVIDELSRHDTLNEMEHWWKRPVELFLGLFGLCNAAVPLTGVGAGTWLVLAGLMIGKPVGITLCTFVGEKFFKLKLPDGMDYRQVVTVGCVAAIGFTVALFVSQSAFGGASREVLDSVKMGALLSFGAAILSFVVAKSLGVRPWRHGAPMVPEKPAE